MKHARSINSRSRFLVRFQKFHSKPIFHQSYTLSANFPISPASRIAHFSVVSVTNTPTPRFLVVSANTHPPVTSPPPPTVRPPRNKKGGLQVHARRPPCYPIIKPMGIEHNSCAHAPHAIWGMGLEHLQKVALGQSGVGSNGYWLLNCSLSCMFISD